MKKLLTLGSLLACATIITACSTQSVISYNDSIVDALAIADDAFTNFSNTLGDDDTSDIEKIQTELNLAIESQNNAIKTIEELGLYDDDATFQNGSIAYLKTNKTLLTDQYQTLFDAMKNETLTDENAKKIIDTIESTITKQVSDLEKIQTTFAAAHNLTIESE